MYTVSADSLRVEIVLIESIDNKIGFELQLKSKPALLSFTEELVFKLEKEISLRDAELLIRDAELFKNIEIINSLYESYRYRIGRFFVRPIEVVALKLRKSRAPKKKLNPSSVIEECKD